MFKYCQERKQLRIGVPYAHLLKYLKGKGLFLVLKTEQSTFHNDRNKWDVQKACLEKPLALTALLFAVTETDKWLYYSSMMETERSPFPLCSSLLGLIRE